jgi:hypothetical protein
MNKKNEKCKEKKTEKKRNEMCDINLFRSYYIISARSTCLVFLAWNVKILRPIWYNVIVRNVFSY